MPGGFQISYGHANFNDQGSTLATSLGTTITASGSTNTKGSYSQLVASTPYDCCGLWLNYCNASQAGVTNNCSLDLAVGGAGSEQIVIPDIILATVGITSGYCNSIFFPIAVPAGTRIAARSQAPSASETVSVNVVLCDGSFDNDQGLSAFKSYGSVLSGATHGTVVDPGGIANTKGAYAQLVASTTYDISSLWAIFDGFTGGSGTNNSLVDIAVGAAASEQVIIPNIFYGMRSSPLFIQALYGPFKVNIPAGTRLSARSQATSNVSGTRQCNLTLMAAS